jgi:hypothetical protein
MLEFLRSLELLQEAQHTQGNQGNQEDQDAKGIQVSQGNQHFKIGNQWLVQEVLCAMQMFSPNEPPSKCKSMSNNLTFRTAAGRITCTQCQAQSKRTKQQCRAPAAKGKTRCRFHGGASTGPKTPEGRARCAAAKVVYGFETRAARTELALGMRRLRELEELGHKLGIMTGPRTPGRKPT